MLHEDAVPARAWRGILEPLDSILIGVDQGGHAKSLAVAPGCFEHLAGAAPVLLAVANEKCRPTVLKEREFASCPDIFVRPQPCR